MSPALAAAVERAQAEARAAGELLPEPAGPVESPFDAAEREVIAAWHSSGEYERIVVDIVAGDPEIALSSASWRSSSMIICCSIC